MPQDDGNASLASLVFLAGFFREETFNIQYVWNAFTKVMADANTQIHFREDSWEQDWFLAKYAADVPGLGITARYVPPEHFSSFPMFDVDTCVEQLAEVPGLTMKRSSTRIQAASLFDGVTADPLMMPPALDEFYELRQRIRAHGDSAMTQLNHTIAWLELAFGPLFNGIALTPVDSNFEQLFQICAQRWTSVWEEKDLYEEYMSVPELIQWKLDVFYGAELQKAGLDMRPSRQGQPEPWREHWSWLSVEVDPELALAAVRLAARLMVSVPIDLLFQQKFRAADTSVTADHLLAAIVFRRWILQLQAMSWLETALQRSWQHLRPQDLTTFAFSALRPHWPRRLFGLSHRSMDIKKTLSATRAWNNFRYSIDATFIPHWETNVATVWGLFSATPGLVRVPSEHYEQSVWCRREHELFDYLAGDDFLDGRYVIDLPEAHLGKLDAVIPANDGQAGGAGPFKPGQFPRLTMVFALFPYEPWENRLLACVAAVRALFLMLRDADLTGAVCSKLANGFSPPPAFEPLTNHPDGWSSVMELFADFQQEWGDDTGSFPIAVPADAYSPEELERERQRFGVIADLQDGAVDEADVLAAFEWHRTIVPALVGDDRYGSFFSIDYRHLTEDVWASDEAFMVMRGVNRIRTSVPLWFLQAEGQRVDEWKGMGASPIFTSYVPGQWDWMMELLQEPGWPANYHNDCKLKFSVKLSAACSATGERGDDYYRGRIS